MHPSSVTPSDLEMSFIVMNGVKVGLEFAGSNEVVKVGLIIIVEKKSNFEVELHFDFLILGRI